jgi:hypothetical protein
MNLERKIKKNGEKIKFKWYFQTQEQHVDL